MKIRITDKLLRDGYNRNNDFRSLTLGPVEVIESSFDYPAGYVFRMLGWSSVLRRNTIMVRRPARRGELQWAHQFVIQHPLKVGGVVFGIPNEGCFEWDHEGNFQGFRTFGTHMTNERMTAVQTYVAERMGLFNFDMEAALEKLREERRLYGYDI